MGFVDWSISVRSPIIYLTLCLSIPSMALYVAEIVTIVRHKNFHKSFYALFVMRAIPDWLGVLDSFYCQRLPDIIGSLLYPIYSKFPNWMCAMALFLSGTTFQANNLVTTLLLLNRLTAITLPTHHEKLWRKLLPLLTFLVYLVPIFLCSPVFKMNATIQLNDPNSTTDRSFVMYEAGDAPYVNYILNVSATFSAIFTVVCVLLNVCTFVAYKLHVKNDGTNGNNNNGHDIEKKLLIYALATFLGHSLVASLLIPTITNIAAPETMTILYIYYPLLMDTGTVVLSSWLLLWASSKFRQQLINDFGIIRKTNIQNNRVGPMEGHRNNNLQAVGGAVGHQYISSVQQLPTVST
uniref:Serpentine receptor class gamma n=1 Tax=Globodera rostochiensis TaxID=31243 RepID=A0A914H453_GLORO